MRSTLRTCERCGERVPIERECNCESRGGLVNGRYVFISEETRDAIDHLPYSDLLYSIVEAYDAMPEQRVREFPAKPGFNRRCIHVNITFPDAPRGDAE